MRNFLLIFIAVFLVGCGLQPPASVLSLTPHTTSKSIYIVKPKDTLHSISRDTGVNYSTLVRLNKIPSPFIIYVGQRLLLRDDSLSVARATVTTANKQFTNIPRETVKKQVKPEAVKDPTQLPKRQQVTNNQRAIPKDVAKQSSIIQVAQKNKLQWVWPIKGPILGRFAVGSTKKKNGVDIGGSVGLLIKAAAPGKVVYSGSGLRGYGNLIIIKHNNNFLSAYAHNRKNIVTEGAEVKLGQSIAEMGNTGANKVMLHFEIRYNGVPVDPEKLLPKK